MFDIVIFYSFDFFFSFSTKISDNIIEQGEHECIHKDLQCSLEKWEFDPMKLTNPFPDNKGSFHM